VLSRKKDGSPNKIASSKRFFCSECSSMLWLHDDAWKDVSRPLPRSLCAAANNDTDCPASTVGLPIREFDRQTKPATSHSGRREDVGHHARILS
jgi:hypothetical protein